MGACGYCLGAAVPAATSAVGWRSRASMSLSWCAPRARRSCGEHGLQIRSPLGDADLPVRCAADDCGAGAQATPFDLVLLSCKAYDLDSSMDGHRAGGRAAGTTRAAASSTACCITPPWMHASVSRTLLGGLCFISATIGAEWRSPASRQAGLDHVRRTRRPVARQARVQAFAAAVRAGRPRPSGRAGHQPAALDQVQLPCRAGGGNLPDARARSAHRGGRGRQASSWPALYCECVAAWPQRRPSDPRPGACRRRWHVDAGRAHR